MLTSILLTVLTSFATVSTHEPDPIFEIDSEPVIEIYDDEDFDPLEGTEHDVIYKITVWFHDRPPLIFYSSSDTLGQPRTTGYKAYEKLANGKFRLKDKSVFIINHDWVDYIEIKEIK